MYLIQRDDRAWFCNITVGFISVRKKKKARQYEFSWDALLQIKALMRAEPKRFFRIVEVK